MYHSTKIFDQLNIDMIGKIAERGTDKVYECRQNETCGFEKSVVAKFIREEYSEADESLNNIFQKLLQRERTDRYQDAEAVQTDLEYYIYNDGCGPTNEKLSVYLGKLFEDAGLFTTDPTLKYFFSTNSENPIETTNQ